MEITKSKFKQYEKELATLTKAQEKLLVEQANAKEFNDLSENSEYSAVTSEIAINRERIKEINEILASAEIVPVDNSPRITLGSTVEIIRLDPATKKPLWDPIVARLDYEGDTVLEDVLGIDSPLGAKIINGTNGDYEIPTNGGECYCVRKIFEDNL